MPTSAYSTSLLVSTSSTSAAAVVPSRAKSPDASAIAGSRSDSTRARSCWRWLADSPRKQAWAIAWSFARAMRSDYRSPDRSFDVVLCVTVLSHVPQGEAAIPELVRVLRSGGRLGVFDLDTGYDSLHPS